MTGSKRRQAMHRTELPGNSLLNQAGKTAAAKVK
jgi:hypothetical protein